MMNRPAGDRRKYKHDELRRAGAMMAVFRLFRFARPYQIQAGGEVYAPKGAAACATTSTDTVGEWFDGLNITFLNTDVSPFVTTGVGLTGRGSEDLSGWWTWSLDSPC
jgi:hypothetical protein